MCRKEWNSCSQFICPIPFISHIFLRISIYSSTHSIILHIFYHNFDNSYCIICQYRYYPYVWYQPLQWQWWAHYCDYPFTISRNFPEHLKVTTFLGASIISSPVFGFRPFRSAFSFTQNLPKPLTMTSSPDTRVCLMIPRRVSTVSMDLFLENPLLVLISSMMSFFVRVMGCSSFGKNVDLRLYFLINLLLIY